MDIALMRKDRALGLAVQNAAYAALLLGEKPMDYEHARPDWPQLYEEVPFGSTADLEAITFTVARDTLAPFVRANPDAPPEALFIHAGDTKVHGAPTNTWAQQPLPLRFAYGLFATTLLYADTMIAADNAARAAAAAKAPPPTLTHEHYAHADEDAAPGELIDRPPGAPTCSAATATEPSDGRPKPVEPSRAAPCPGAAKERGPHGRANKKPKKQL